MTWSTAGIQYHRGLSIAVTCFVAFAASVACAAASCNVPEGTANFEFRSGSNRLRGFVDLPRASGKHPAILIVHGSGATDVTRGEADHAGQYRKLREAFRAAGFAAVVWDKAGNGCSEGRNQWPDDFSVRATEIIDALAELKRRGDIDSERIGAWGISQAGWVIPMAAVRTTDLAFLIIVNGPGRDLSAQWHYLLWNSAQASGASRTEALADANTLSRAFAIAAAGGTHAQYAATVESLKKYALVRDSGLIDITPEAYAAAQAERLFLVSADSFLPHIRIPVLALFGNRDAVVDWRRSERIYRESFEATQNPHSKIRIFADADHFMHHVAPRRSDTKDTQGKREFVDGYLETMVSWLRRLPIADDHQ